MRSPVVPLSGGRLKAACSQVRNVSDKGVFPRFEHLLPELDRIIWGGNKRGVYNHLNKTVGMEGARSKEEQYIMDEGVVLQRKKGNIRSRLGWFSTPFYTRNRPSLSFIS